MRKLLLAAIVCMPFLAGGRAEAQIPVTDVGNLVAQAKNLLQAVQTYGTELQQLQTQIQSYLQLVYMGENFIHDPTLGAAMALANQLGLGSSIPINPMAIQQLIAGGGGLGGVTGLLGRLNGMGNLVNNSWVNSNVFTCQTADFACQVSHMQSAGTAGANGAAVSMLNDITNHLGVLQGLRTRLQTAVDPKTVADAQAQISTEGSWIQGETAQLQAIGIMTQTQDTQNGIAATQKFQGDATTFIQAGWAQQ